MNREDYNNLKRFWDFSFRMNEETKKEILEYDMKYNELAPAIEHVDLIKKINKDAKMLDYGCGIGWASIIAAKEEIKNITAVDVSENSINLAKVYAQKFGCLDNIDFKAIDEDWLAKEKDKTYDFILTSNVLDVIFDEITFDILDNFSRILKDDGTLVVSLNYYVNPNDEKSKTMDIRDNKYVYFDNVLRLNSHSDQEWIDIFSKHFKLIELKYFSWAGEEKKTRRLFILKKK